MLKLKIHLKYNWIVEDSAGYQTLYENQPKMLHDVVDFWYAEGKRNVLQSVLKFDLGDCWQTSLRRIVHKSNGSFRLEDPLKKSFLSKVNNILFWGIATICFCIFTTNISCAAKPNYSIHAEWTSYTPPSGFTVTGYKLYQEDVFVCSTDIPTATSLDCNVVIISNITNFTLSASFVDATESPKSSSFAFSLKIPANFKLY